MHLGDPPERVELPPQSVVAVEPGTALQLRNDGDEEVVVLIWGAPPEQGGADFFEDAEPCDRDGTSRRNAAGGGRGRSFSAARRALNRSYICSKFRASSAHSSFWRRNCRAPQESMSSSPASSSTALTDSTTTSSFASIWYDHVDRAVGRDREADRVAEPAREHLSPAAREPDNLALRRRVDAAGPVLDVVRLPQPLREHAPAARAGVDANDPPGHPVRDEERAGGLDDQAEGALELHGRRRGEDCGGQERSEQHSVSYGGNAVFVN